MAAEVASAFVSLMPTMSKQDMEKAITGAVNAGVTDKPGRTVGQRINKGFSRVFKGGMLAAGAIGATALTKGFGRLKAIDDAKQKLKGLEYSGKEIESIMDNALGAVKGTAFGLGDAANVAAGALGSGVKPGKELEGVLTTIADSAAFAQTDLSSMGAIFNKVSAKGKVQGQEILQLMQHQIPVLDYLADSLGVTTQEAQEMASAGEISFEEFAKAMDEGLGGSALAAGDTFGGAVDNVGAALGRLGANVLEGAFPAIKDLLASSIGIIDEMGPAAEDIGLIVGNAFSAAAESVAAFFEDFRDGKGTAGEIRDVLGVVFALIMNVGVPAFMAIAGFLGRNIKLVAAVVAGYLAIQGAMLAYRKTMAAVKAVQVAYNAVLTGGRAIGAAVTAVKYSMGAAQKFYSATVRGGTGAVAANTVAEKVGMALGKTKIAVTKGMAAAQRLLNAAMRANPIGLIITAVLILIGVFTLLYKKNETFRRIVDKAWAGVQKAIGAVVDWFKDTAWPAIKSVYDWVKSGAAKLADGFVLAKNAIAKALRPVLTIITFPFKAAYVIWETIILGLIYLFKQTVAGIKKFWNPLLALLKKPIRIAVDWITRKIDDIRKGFIKQRDRVRRLWDKMLGIVRKPINAAIVWVQKHLDRIRARFLDIRNKVRTLWNVTKAIVMAPVRAAIAWIGRKVDDIRKSFLNARNKVRTLWNKLQEMLKKPVRRAGDWIMDKADDVKKKFKDVRDGIGTAWKKVTGKITKPVKDALRWVNKNLIGTANTKGFNFLLAKIGSKRRIDPIGSFARGGWTGPGHKYKPAGVVHADEFVVKKSSRARFERENPGTLDYINRHGKLPGYADGGIVALGKRIRRMGYQVGEHPAFGGVAPVHSKNSYHYRNQALDINADYGAAHSRHGGEMAALDALNKILRREGWRTIWRAPNHYDHLHVDTGNGGGGGGLFSFFGSIWDSLKGAVSSVKDKAMGLLTNIPGSGIMPDVIKGLGKMSVNAFADYAKGIIKDLFSFGGGNGTGAGGTEQWRGLVSKALRMVGEPQSLIPTVLRRMAQESGGDPNALNDWDSNARRGTPSKGLMQVIDPTFRANAFPGYNDIWDPLSNILASLRYAKRRYGSVAAGYNLPGGYADGGLVTPAVRPLLFDKGGYLPEGISLVENRTGAPEPLMRMNGGGGMTFNLIDADGVLIGTMRGVAQDEAAYSATIGRQYY